MEILKNIEIEGAEGKPITLDIFIKANNHKKPLVIFCHGFKGFKDWGGWNQTAKIFAQNDFVFLKFNFSHNGTTVENPSEFQNLEAFGENTFSKELEDLDKVVNWVMETPLIPNAQIDYDKIYLIGHSRGGGIAIIKAYEDDRIKKLVTWSSINNFGHSWQNQELLDKWKAKGSIQVENKRTHQLMPLNYSLYEDYIENKHRLNIERAVTNMKIPFMAIHGTEDPTVPFEQSMQMKSWNINVKLDLIPLADHVYGMKHPPALTIPFDLSIVIEHTVAFLKQDA